MAVLFNASQSRNTPRLTVFRTTSGSPRSHRWHCVINNRKKAVSGKDLSVGGFCAFALVGGSVGCRLRALKKSVFVGKQSCFLHDCGLLCVECRLASWHAFAGV